MDFDPRKGQDQAGRRPALVISPSAYNAESNCVLVCPITSNTVPWPWKVPLPDDGQVRGAVLVNQIKSIDAKARYVKSAHCTVSRSIMQDILARLAPLGNINRDSQGLAQIFHKHLKIRP